MASPNGRELPLPLLALPLALAACAMPVDEDDGTAERVGTAAQPLHGVPTDGYPSWDELQGLVAMNRGRADPNNPAAGTADECSEHRDPQPPLLHDHDAAQAARFHCAHLTLNMGGLSHKTFCDLREDIESNGCDGSASCSCEAGSECWSCDTLGGCGTNHKGRMERFGFPGNPTGENGAAGYGGFWAAVGGWITESPCHSSTQGHRNAITAAGSNVAGTGAYSGSGCWSTYQFADFGKIDGLVVPRIASAVHRPESGSAATEFTFYANYYDAQGAPQAVDVVIEGTCHPMAAELGSAGNLTLTANASVGGEGCHRYWILAYDSTGERATYPEAGSYVIAIGGADCGEGYHTTERPLADCDELECATAEICDNGLDDDCNGLADDGCSDLDVEGEDDDGGCDCRTAPGRSPVSPRGWGLVGLAALWSLRRRRRRSSAAR